MKNKLLFVLVSLVVIGFTAVDGIAEDSLKSLLKNHGTYISVSGKAVDTGPDAFSLDFGKGVVEVKTEGLNWYRENFNYFEGHNVTVYGEIDDDLYETNTIKAISLYDEDLATFFFHPFSGRKV